MAQYGQLLNAFDPEKDEVYTHFDSYFNQPVLIKVKDVENYSVYMTKTYCLLSGICRYIMTFVPTDEESKGTPKLLSELKWESLQTRTLMDDHDIPSHAYNARMGTKLDAVIERTSITDESSVYKCEDLPITLTLLHKNPGTPSEYQKTGTVVSAVETYQTIITFTS